MGSAVLALACFSAFLVASVESVCNGIYYESCTEYYAHKGTRPCGWWGRCDQYSQKSRNKQCARNCRNGNIDGWGGWGSCSKQCGSGVRTRKRLRRCNHQCRSKNYYETQQQACNTSPCKVNGGWSSYSRWGAWSTCSVTCGTGTQTHSRTRACNNPSPKHGGSNCLGEATQTQQKNCVQDPCPVNGGWSEFGDWSDWSMCTETCGEGMQESFKTRTCNNPEPKYNGQPCSGDSKEVREKACNLQKCPGYCECSTVGDTHYKTFDGQWIHFIGASRFQLAKSDDSETSCPFSAFVINDGIMPYKRTIELTIKELEITLLPEKKILVNGARTNVPYTTPDKTVNIFLAGRYVRVETDCEIDLEWDGSKSAELVITDSFARRMNGICGNCDKELNELTNNNETLSQSEFAKQYAQPVGITGALDDSEEIEVTELPEVSDAIATIAAGNDYCGYLLSKEDTPGPFQECLTSSDINADEQYQMCVQDVGLHYNSDSDTVRQSVCDNMAALATQCAEKDIAVEWRKSDFCPMNCGDNMVYSHHVSGCQTNCVNKNSNKSCEFPFTEGCVCNEGYILGGTTCVRIEECGCDSPVGYIASEEQVVSSDCEITYKCVNTDGTVHLETDLDVECHSEAECKLNDVDARSCICKEEFEGDGIKECKAVKKDCKTTKKGETYDGKISKTEKGFDCQAWAVKSPHKHKYTEKLGDQSNYCRNPDNSRQPWCYTSSKSKRWDYCVIPDCEREIKECSPDAKGKEYNGLKSTTMSGRTCQSWSSSTPHKHRYSKRESIESEVNHCRNFDGSKQPWCYTTDPKKRWEYCDIPPCEVKECLSSSDAKGRNYQGKIKITKNGHTCQPWGSDEPHKHNYNGITGDHCRNPDGSKHPWCYTTDPKKRWDYCDIPMC